jgi:nucleoside-diphosphate-sugar epimerase
MKVFVAGATGVLGGRAVPLLVRAGHQVTGVARTPAKADAMRAVGATPVAVDLFDAADVRAAVGDHDVVINLATHIPGLAKASRSSAWAENDRIRTEAARNLVDAALAGAAARYVQESISFFYADGGSAWVDETSPFEAPAFAASVHQAEAEALRFTDAGRIGVILRFGWFYGAGASHTDSQLAMARRGLSPFPGKRSGYQTLIHLDDAAAAVPAALDVAAGTYNITEDEPATRGELAAAVARALGRKPGLTVPGVVRLGGQKTAHLASSTRVSNRRFRAASSWAPAYPSPQVGWEQVVAESGVDGATA